MELFRIAVAVVLIGIVVSLGSALFHLMNDKGDSKKMVRALTVRVGLSVALFLLLMAAWALGFIQPLGVSR
ncbi:MAG: twin transmembrane helix small protein [Steroidobacteraceae bacterium]